MAAGDTQEIVFAQIAAGGTPGYSRFASISLLKKSVSFAQKLYKSNFIPPAELKNVVNLKAMGMDREIILTWGSEVDKVKEIETFPQGIYSFQGYNVYQISKNELTLGDKKLIATFDIKDDRVLYLEETVEPVRGYVQRGFRQFGTDSGIQRFISIKKDFLNNTPLNNGSDYEFGISYFGVADDFNFPYGYIESDVSTVAVTPQSFKPGIRYESKFGDIVEAIHVSGNSLAKVTALILDPGSVTGNEYEIYFKYIDGLLSFNLKNITTNKVLLSDRFNLSGDNDFIVTEGFILRVADNAVKPLNEGDLYRLTAPRVIYDEKLAGEDIEKINVFPNPYYGHYSNEFNRYDRHVTFSHLPPRAVIRIFNIAGQMVRKLEKDNPDQFMRWNMLSETSFQIPSGIYIVHIDLPDLGKYKILKLAIFTEDFTPDRF
jgi:hypothetical protein